MSSSITVDTSDFVRAMEAGAEELRNEARDATAEICQKLADRTVQLAPKDKDPRAAAAEAVAGDKPISESVEVVRTGPDSWEVRITSRHAGFVEYGTSRTRAQPFARPAIAEAER